MFFKLSLRNVKRSYQDYAIYFITLILAVSVFYIFNSLSSQDYLVTVFQGANIDSIETIETLIVYLSIFISFILGFLIIYANSFIFKRRKRELGIYLTLGMERKDISRILLIETLIIGILSLGIGIGVSIPLSQAFGVLVFRIMDIYIEELNFVFSWFVMGRTIVYFGIMFLAVIMLNVFSVSRYKIISLIHAQKKKQKLGIPSSWVALVIFILAIGLLGWTYGVVLSQDAFQRIFIAGDLVPVGDLLPVFVFGVTGTFLLFLSLAGFLVVMIKRSPRLYYQSINLFTLRQISSRIQTNWISISFICLMISVSICSASVGMALGEYYRDDSGNLTPFDVTMTFLSESSVDEDLYELNLNQYTEESYPLTSYSRVGFVYSNLFDWNAEMFPDFLLIFYHITEVNQILAAQGIEPVELLDNEILLILHGEDVTEESLITDKFKIDGEEYRIAEVLTEGELRTDFKRLNDNVSVVFPDHVQFDNGEDFFKTVTRSFNYSGDAFLQELKLVEYFRDQNEFNIDLMTKNMLIQEEKITLLTITFVSFYLSVIFILVSMAILALQQLTDAVESEERYQILKKIGVDCHMKNKSLLVQIGIYFLLPLFIASIHSMVALIFFNRILIEETARGTSNPLLMISAATMVFGIYILYFFATYIQSKRILGEK